MYRLFVQPSTSSVDKRAVQTKYQCATGVVEAHPDVKPDRSGPGSGGD